MNLTLFSFSKASFHGRDLSIYRRKPLSNRFRNIGEFFSILSRAEKTDRHKEKCSLHFAIEFSFFPFIL